VFSSSSFVNVGDTDSSVICQVYARYERTENKAGAAFGAAPVEKLVPPVKKLVLAYRLSRANKFLIGRNDWHKKMRIVPATCIDYMFALIYGFRMPVRMHVVGVRIGIAALYNNPQLLAFLEQST
jgi:hypothetical protein